MANKYSKLVKSSGIFAIGNLGSKFISILMLPLYTSELSQSEFGQVDLITVTIALLLPIFTISIVEAVVRFSLERKYKTYGEVISNGLVFVIVGILLLVCLYPLLEKIEYIRAFINIFYILFIIQALSTFVKQFTRSINLTIVYMQSDMIFTSVFAILNILFLVFLKLGIEGYFFSLILAYFFDLIFLSIKSKVVKYVGFRYLDKQLIKTMFFYCLPLMPNTIMWWIINLSDRYLLVHFMSLSANGIYAIASRFPTLVSNISAVFFKAWQISAIEESESEEKDTFYSNVFCLFFFAMVLDASLYNMFNKNIISLMVSPDFYEAWKYAPLLVLGAVFSSFSSFIGTNYVAMKKTKGAFYTSGAGAFANIILNIILIPLIGILGAAISTMISFMLMWIYRIIDTKNFVKINYPYVRMTITILLLGFQIMIGYFQIGNMLSWIFNILIIGIIMALSFKFTKVPLLVGFNKIFKRI